MIADIQESKGYGVYARSIEEFNAYEQKHVQKSKSDDTQPKDLVAQVTQLAKNVQELKENMRSMKEDMHWLVKSNRTILETIVPVGETELNPDISDMPPSQIKDLILKEVTIGEPFYPSDIAMKHNLDFDLVLEVIDELRNEGRIRNRK